MWCAGQCAGDTAAAGAQAHHNLGNKDAAVTGVSANTAKEHRYSNNTMQLTTQLHRYFSQVQSVGEFRFACLYFIDLQHSDCFCLRSRPIYPNVVC